MIDMKLDKRALQYYAQAKLPKTFQIQASAGDKPAEMLIYDAIGLDGVTALDVAESLSTISEHEPLRVRVNSPGGSAFDGHAIYSALTSRPGDVEIVVDGVAASAASIIAMAGNRVLMQPASMMMIHNAWALAVGNKGDLRQTADVLSQMDDLMAGIYAQQAAGTKEDWAARMEAETWFNAQEATQAGLAHGIVEQPQKKKGLVAALKSMLSGEKTANELREEAGLAPLAPSPRVPGQTTPEEPEAEPQAANNNDYDLPSETERRRRLLRTLGE